MDSPSTPASSDTPPTTSTSSSPPIVTYHPDPEDPSLTGTSTLFLVESDVHFKNGKIREVKTRSVQKILALKAKYPRIAAIVCAGDLTDGGCDGAKLEGVHIGGHDKQLPAYIKNYEQPLVKAGITVYDNIGNHDNVTYFPLFSRYMPVKNYIKRKHGGLCYAFRINELFGFSLGLYPNKEGLQWLDKALHNVDTQAPIIISFHFNLSGLWSNWWKEEEKEEFYKHISSRNVKAIICGHQHMSMTNEWKGITVVQGAGSPIMLCEYIEGKLSVTFH